MNRTYEVVCHAGQSEYPSPGGWSHTVEVIADEVEVDGDSATFYRTGVLVRHFASDVKEVRLKEEDDDASET